MEKHTAREFDCAHCGEPMLVKFLKPGEMALCKSCGSDVTVPESLVGDSLDQPQSEFSDQELEIRHAEVEARAVEKVRQAYYYWGGNAVGIFILNGLIMYFLSLSDREFTVEILRRITSAEVYDEVFRTLLTSFTVVFFLIFGIAAIKSIQAMELKRLNSTLFFNEFWDAKLRIYKHPFVRRAFLAVLSTILMIEGSIQLSSWLNH